jgi:aerotaxis receptor
MRQNLPITGTEHPFPRGKILVSKTDLKSHITYCNDAFIQLSGFGKEELLGQPHNIVRHPDMPAEVFADMWRTLEKGYPWRGLVKNRRKNGDHYWVDALAVPISKNGEPVGFMSVRTEPARPQVQAAEALYRDIRAGSPCAPWRVACSGRSPWCSSLPRCPGSWACPPGSTGPWPRPAASCARASTPT